MMRLSVVHVLNLAGMVVLATGCTKEFCLPGDTCWPSAVDIALFKADVLGELLQPFDLGYLNEVKMKNTRFTKSPGLVLLAQTPRDVQKALLFAKRFNIRLTVLSSGHDRTGKSTADGSLLVNLSRMTGSFILLEDERYQHGTITVGSGNTWNKIYEEVDRVGRVVVGGSSATVAVGGFTTGGGHGPLSRSLGLAADNLLQVEMVTANGSIVTASAQRTTETLPDGETMEMGHSDLFWAIRGGGGGTFGIITSFTFKLHLPPKSLVSLFCGYPLVANESTAKGKYILSTYLNYLPTLPHQWSGYFVTSRSDPVILPGTESAMFAVLLHYGPWPAPTRAAVQPLIDQLTNLQFSCEFTNVSSFWEWKRNFTDDASFRTYVSNTFLHYDSLRPELSDLIVRSSDGPLSPETDARLSCTFSLLGGKVSQVPADWTAVSPAFRSALVSLTCGTGWQDAVQDDINVRYMVEFGKKLRRYGRGVYYNEPDQNLTDWKSQFWGSHYPRLLEAKKAWDPTNTFFCRQCVGSDSIPVSGCNSTSEQTEMPNNGSTDNSTAGSQPKRDFTGQKFCSRYCTPGNPCWPSDAKIEELSKSLDGRLLTPNMKGYSQLVIMKDTLYTKHPAIVVLATSNKDVQRSIAFVKRYNIRLTVLSSGHDYNGRSTADGSLQINFSYMNQRKVNVSDTRSDTGATIYAQTGNVWADIYIEVDKYDKIIVGGNAQTVAMGGYTMGGGHSIFSRSLGLAVDNVVEFEMVLADGTLVTATANGTTFVTEDGSVAKSPSTDLYWAVLGGGGGTYGVATSFTYKLHQAPPQVVSWYCVYPLNVGDNFIGKNVTTFFHSLLPKLSPKWGGYYIYKSLDPITTGGVIGSLSFVFLYNGPWGDPGIDGIRPLMSFMAEHQYYCDFTNFTSFHDYKKNTTDPIYYRNYVFNALLQNDTMTPDLTETIFAGFFAKSLGDYGCVGTILGGKVSEVPDKATSVHPGFRTTLSSMSCALAWLDPNADEVNIAASKKLGIELHKFSRGVYVNEPQMFLPTWKEDFWGPNYDRLLSIKQRWDRHGLFYCRHCVGSDLIERFSCNHTEPSDRLDVPKTEGCDSYTNPLYEDLPITDQLPDGMGFCSRYCTLGNPCWPTAEELAQLDSSTTGYVVVQSNPEFQTGAESERISSSPAIAVLPKSVSDIQKTLMFATRHNLHVAPITGGAPEASNRPYQDSSLQIMMNEMRSVNVSLDDSTSPTGASVSVQTGSTWAQVLQEVDKYGKVVVGPADPWVFLHEFSSAGGYGALSRSLGLAVDNILSFNIVLPGGESVELSENKAVYLFPNGTLSETSDPELFWAVRGGGSDAFGILSEVTFVLHDSPAGYIHFKGVWRLNNGSDSSYGQDMLEQFHRVLPQLSAKWGGYLVTAIDPPTVTVSLLHFGSVDESSAMQEIDIINSIESEGQLGAELSNYTSYQDYHGTLSAEQSNHGYVFNTLLQYETDPKRAAEFIVNVTAYYGTCTEILMGGKVSEARADSAAVNPALRTAAASLTCGFTWNNSSAPDTFRRTIKTYSNDMRDLGHGMYLSEADTDLPDWQEDVWGFHYDLLSDLKEEVDPNYLLTCHRCVGSELVMEYYNESYDPSGHTGPGYQNNYTRPTIGAVDFVEKNEFVSRFCVHGLPCWPSKANFVSLNSSLEGSIITPQDVGYSRHTRLVNKLRSRSPGVIVFPHSVSDVQRTILFARQHNLRVTVVSSGHGFNGKNTADGSLQINLFRMRRVWVESIDPRSPTAESVTAEGGADWTDIYKEVDKWSRRVVVGPSSLSLSPGGYVMAGGFSPLSPSHGLAVDNTIAFQMVTADGRVVNSTKTETIITNFRGNVTSEPSTELFWALRGGGGGTFGIVTSVTYQIHPAPSQIVQFSCIFTPTENPKSSIQEVINFFHAITRTLPQTWGGQFIVSNSPGVDGTDMSFAAVQLLHNGPWDAVSREAVDPFFNFRQEWQTSCGYSTKNSFWEYIKDSGDIPYERTYIANGLVPEEMIGSKLTNTVISQLFNNSGRNSEKTCFYDIIGGQVSGYPSDMDSVNPRLREARLSAVCSITWSEAMDDAPNVAAGVAMSQALYSVTKGVYPNYAAYDLPAWKTDFWDNKYEALLEVKKKWDPENFLYCRHCVGSDLVANFRKQTSVEYRPTTAPKAQATPNSSVGQAPSPTSLTWLLFLLLLLVR